MATHTENKKHSSSDTNKKHTRSSSDSRLVFRSRKSLARENRKLSKDVQTLDEENRQIKDSNGHSIAILKAEIAGLKEKLKEVALMNTRWQKYNEQREQYVGGLHRDVADLEAQVQEFQQQGMISAKQQREIDKMLIASKEKVHAIETEKELVEGELIKCRQHCQKIEAKCRKHETTIKDMEENVQRLLEAQNNTESSEMIELLRDQIRVITQDFEDERRDREAAHERIADLEKELDILRLQLRQFQDQACSVLANRRFNALAIGDQGCMGHSHNGEYNPRTGGYDVPDSVVG